MTQSPQDADGPQDPNRPQDPPSGDGPPSGYGPPGAYGPGTTSPAPPASRFAGAFVALGVLLGLVGIVGLPLLLLGIASALGSDRTWLFPVALGVGVLTPLVVGVVLVATGSPTRRGTGLGLLIGWGAGLVVGGGLCIALVAALSNGSGP